MSSGKPALPHTPEVYNLSKTMLLQHTMQLLRYERKNKKHQLTTINSAFGL
jgi:hypothetical protein